MSTFFHSAAMTLLSRTLQTLLSKYLSDVDVEGVELPSLYSSDGHSGWGVRLSNVKLREGAKLMELPGKPKKRKAPKQKKKTTGAAAAAAADGKEASQKDPNASITSDGQDKSKEAQDTPTTTTESAELLSKNDNEEAEAMEQQTVQTVAESDAESIASKTTSATTSSSWFLWRSRPKEESMPAVVEQKYSSGSVPSVEADLASEYGTKENGTTNDSGPSRKGVVEVVYDAETKKEKIEVDDEDAFGELDNDDEDSGDEEEDGDDEAPMILRLGAGGTIGILDVRLVNKEVHVMVEDAFLTVEAVQLEPDEGDDGTDKDAKAKGANDKKKVQKKVLDPKSVGDRVLKENAIARLLSAIPNLFLRDIQVRFIVREEVVRAMSNKEESVPESSSNTDNNGDVTVDLGIEFLSVTDGEDFMANFRGEDESSDGEDSADDDDDSDDRPRMNALSGYDSPYNQNEFFAKRIRTGRGPEGGLTLRIYPSGELGNGIESVNPKPLWARHSWVSSTQYCVLRLSGFDLLARIYFGEKTGDVVDSSEWFVDEYDEYSVDSMLFGGVDYIAPGPKPPLPPMPRRGATTVTDDEEIVWDHPGVSTYIADSNGIQSCTLNSSFYKVARGLTPTMCDKDHLPCEWCSSCWVGAPGIAIDHEKDRATPMPGLVLNISTRDPIEINIDRPSLEVIGLLVGLFQKAPTPDSPALDMELKQTKSEVVGDMDSSEISKSSYHSIGSSQLSVPSTAANPRGAPKTITSQNSLRGMISRGPVLEEEEEEDSEDCFPSYMQPEKIQILGLHLSEINVRMHVMRADDAFDSGLSFCYWEVLAKCVTADQQQLKALENQLQDIRIDVGYLKVIEHKGVERKQLVSIGMKQRVVEFDEMTVETMTKEENNRRSPWPSTAAALLEMQPPLETLPYEARDRHALQFRYIKVNSPGLDYDTIRTHANIRVGIASVDAPLAIRTDARTILDQARESVLGPRPEASEPGTPEEPVPKSDALMKYKMQIDGGHVRLDPKIDVRLPLTKFCGERSSDTGLFFETLLDRVSLRYGEHAPADSLHQRGLSLEQLAELSENVRLRILLFVKDLRPLEAALGVAPESNSFLRCRAVNKGIVKMAKKVRKSQESRTSESAVKPTTRRQELVTELLRMDDDSMEELWAMYTSRQKAKKRANGR
jgi:hypothetical protein